MITRLKVLGVLIVVGAALGFVGVSARERSSDIAPGPASVEPADTSDSGATGVGAE